MDKTLVMNYNPQQDVFNFLCFTSARWFVNLAVEYNIIRSHSILNDVKLNKEKYNDTNTK